MLEAKPKRIVPQNEPLRDHETACLPTSFPSGKSQWGAAGLPTGGSDKTSENTPDVLDAKPSTSGASII
jgi:hypothetical protein